MPVKQKLSFTSCLGQHCHILWTDDQHAGHHVSVHSFKKELVITLPPSSFDLNMTPLKYGRFYPVEILKGSFNSSAKIFRITGIDERSFTIDFNHPLAGKKVRIKTTSCRDESSAVGEPLLLLEWAGMDAPLNKRDTDYSILHAYDRTDSSDDTIFYEKPRNVTHVDQTCISRIRALYSSMLHDADSVLDLMSSWRSHLPEKILRATGLGMNSLEMKDNPQLHAHVVHDLNANPELPFDDGVFHAVVNTVSIEYLIEPERIFAEVRRILKPGGLFIVTFSNRYFSPKAIRLWTELHPAERLGWVLQLLSKAGFSDLHSQVERGLQRSRDDRYAGQIEEMDPLFAAWGRA